MEGIDSFLEPAGHFIYITSPLIKGRISKVKSFAEGCSASK